MNALSRPLALALVPVAMMLSATAAQAQVEDLAIPLTSCTPNTGPSLTGVQMNTVGGFVRAPNAAAGTVAYTCNLLDSYVDFVPNWTRIGLQYRDTFGGRIQLSLYAKNKVTGASALTAVVNTPASAAINNVSVALPALNYAVFSYYAVVRMASSPNNPPEAHLVRVEQ
jgi:hypothetical protein